MSLLRLDENPNEFFGGDADDLLAKRSTLFSPTTEEASSADRLRQLHEAAQNAFMALRDEVCRQLVDQGVIDKDDTNLVDLVLESDTPPLIVLPFDRHNLYIEEDGTFV